MSLPQDPIILLSCVNTLLRDRYPSLAELCAAEGVEETDLRATLSAVNYEYSEEYNKFI
jgi:hypothetical protein